MFIKIDSVFQYQIFSTYLIDVVLKKPAKARN